MTRGKGRAAAIVRRHGPALGAIVVVATAASLWNLRSVLDRWSTAVPARLDNRFQAWVLHWVQGGLMGEHSLYDAVTFAPASASLTFSDHLIGLGAVLLPLHWLGLGPAAMFNTAIVLGTVANAVSGYVLGYVLTRRRSAALVAGVVFSLGPVPWLVTRHVNLVWRWGLAIVVALVWVLADRHRGRRQWVSWPSDRVLLVVLGVVVAWQGLVSFFYCVFVLLVATVAVAARFGDLRGRLRGLAIAVGIGVLAFVPSYLPYLATRANQTGFEWSLDQAASLRAAPDLVEQSNIVWGGTLGSPLFWNAGLPSFPGITVIVLFVAALLVARAWSRREQSAAVPGLGIALVVVGALGALGPGWGSTRDWTPFAIAFRFVPGFSALRESGRFVLVVLLGVTILAAMVVAMLAARVERVPDPGRRRRSVAVVAAITLLVVGAVVIEGAADERDVTSALPHYVDKRLAGLPEPGGVAYLPVAFGTLAVLDVQEGFVIRSAVHDRRMVNGFAGFYPRSSRVLARRLADTTSSEALDCLARYDIRFVVVNKTRTLGLGSELTDPARAAPLELVADEGGDLLYRVPDRDVAPDACPLPGVD